jgi:hypothetical protein
MEYVKEKYRRNSRREGKTETEIEEKLPSILEYPPSLLLLTTSSAATKDFIEWGESNFMAADLIERAEAEVTKEEEGNGKAQPNKTSPVWVADSDEEWLLGEGIISSEEEWL